MGKGAIPRRLGRADEGRAAHGRVLAVSVQDRAALEGLRRVFVNGENLFMTCIYTYGVDIYCTHSREKGGKENKVQTLSDHSHTMAGHIPSIQ